MNYIFLNASQSLLYQYDWDDYMGRFRQSVNLVMEFFTEVISWAFSNPFIVVFLTISIIIAVFELIKKAKDGVE